MTTNLRLTATTPNNACKYTKNHLNNKLFTILFTTFLFCLNDAALSFVVLSKMRKLNEDCANVMNMISTYL